MKKLFFSVILALLLAFTLTACGNNETPGGDGPGDNGGDIVQEGIVWSGVDDVTIARGDNFDLLAGVTATDGKDGDISDAIVVRDDGDFSSEYTGRYVIEYQVVNSEGIISRAERQISVQVMHNVANGKFDTPSRSWSFDVPGGGGRTAGRMGPPGWRGHGGRTGGGGPGLHRLPRERSASGTCASGG